MINSAVKKLKSKFEKGLHLCVGLDTDTAKIPEHLKTNTSSAFEFNRQIIENTKDLVCAYKLNFAFYEKEGLEGLSVLKRTIEVIPDDVLIIADAKRGDIGNTSAMYARSIFDYFNCDALTLHPYMGYDSVESFLEYRDKLNFILALTSNKSADDFEKRKLANGKYLYEEVIEKVNSWNNYGNCAIVFGATNPEELRRSIKSFGNLIVLLPGVGAQGGSLEKVVQIFSEADNSNFIVNISRAIIYADSGKLFYSAARERLTEYNNDVSTNI